MTGDWRTRIDGMTIGRASIDGSTTADLDCGLQIGDWSARTMREGADPSIDTRAIDNPSIDIRAIDNPSIVNRHSSIGNESWVS
jgi:hypothetical protein